MDSDDLERLAAMPPEGCDSAQRKLADVRQTVTVQGQRPMVDARTALWVTFACGAFAGYEFHHVAQYMGWIVG